MAIKVTRKDQNEANENLIRRFNRKVLQSGIMPLKKSQMRFSKPISKRERRAKASGRQGWPLIFLCVMFYSFSLECQKPMSAFTQA